MYPYGQYGRPQMPPGFPGIPGMGMPPGLPPSFGMAPGTGAPGTPGLPPPPGTSGAPPGTLQANMPTRPGMAGFVPPANLPNINFNAPIIRLGTSVTRQNPVPSAGGKGGMGGMGSGGQMFSREVVVDLVPPTVEEQLKTVFVGSIPSGLGDEWMERILRSAASLKKWTRATNENGDPCKFGFAEYEDSESLGCAIEVLKDLEIPAIDDKSEGTKLMVVVDDISTTYLENCQEHSERQQPDYPALQQSRIDASRSAIASTLSELNDPTKRASTKPEPTTTSSPTATKSESETPAKQEGDPSNPQPEIVTIPLSADDELSDIPADMREMVAKEIAAFRERSNRRDLERLKREEEIEKMERERNAGPRINRLASPPPSSTPTGPSGGANAIPIGPSRLRGEGPPSRAPTGPSAGVQIPRDYQKGVAFVNGTHPNGYMYSKEEEDSDASDEELERRRKTKKAADAEKNFLDHERRWLNRERSRTSALEREQIRDAEDEAREVVEKQAMAKRLETWDDDVEVEKKLEEYYVDRSMWIRNRAAFRARETEMDDRDRASEVRQAELDVDKKRAAENMADNFLARQAEEMEKAAATVKEPQKFKLALGAAAASKKHEASAPRRKTAAEVEGLLEDEEEDDSNKRRVLVPITYDATSVMDEETREKLVRQLAQEIPSDRTGLFEWRVQWDHVDEAIIGEKLQPFVEKKIMEYLGVQEQELVGFVLDHIRKRGTAEGLVKELEMALGEDGETMVKKVWRMVIFYSESEKRGLN